MSNFDLILEKLEIKPYLRGHLWSSLENPSRGQTYANEALEKYTLWKISCFTRKSWSRLLIPTISRVPFEKTVKNITKITTFWKKMKFFEIDQD